jgi:hypothetical protein
MAAAAAGGRWLAPGVSQVAGGAARSAAGDLAYAKLFYYLRAQQGAL